MKNNGGVWLNIRINPNVEAPKQIKRKKDQERVWSSDEDQTTLVKRKIK